MRVEAWDIMETEAHAALSPRREAMKFATKFDWGTEYAPLVSQIGRVMQAAVFPALVQTTLHDLVTVVGHIRWVVATDAIRWDVGFGNRAGSDLVYVVRETRDLDMLENVWLVLPVLRPAAVKEIVTLLDAKVISGRFWGGTRYMFVPGESYV